jgi:hypothetical protein
MSTILERTIAHQVKIPLSGAEVAELFWSLDENAQSDFFNRLGHEDRLVFQLQAVTDCKRLDQNGRYAMTRIGEYGPTTAETP